MSSRLLRTLLFACGLLSSQADGHFHDMAHDYLHAENPLLPDSTTSADAIPFSTRAHWMRRAIQALEDAGSPCPFYAFGTAIVNHTSTSDLGDLVCIGSNMVDSIGNPSLHGEIAGIANCTAVLTDPEGPYKVPIAEAGAAWKDLTLYTTGEPCPMCASAIRWAGFKECVYGTSISTLIAQGWGQIQIRSQYVFEQSGLLGPITKLLGDVLSNETDALFKWQYYSEPHCPKGCGRDDSSGLCAPSMQEQ